MLLSSFIHSNQHFKTLTQSFYIALSQNTIRTRNKISAGVLIIRGRNNYTRGRWAPRKCFRKICRKLSHSAEKDPIPYLNTCIAYLNTLSQLHISPDSSRQHPRLHILIHCRLGNTLGSQSQSSITSPESSANQNRVLRNPSRHYVTLELSARGEDPSRLSARVGSL